MFDCFDISSMHEEIKLHLALQIALFNAGIVLLMNIWGAKRSGSIADPVKEMKEVHKVMDMFKTLEARYVL